MRRVATIVAFLSLSFLVDAQTRPKIGVTLSGGGAKGLAHIGVLKAIDSAGLKVDYVTGTSMGSIIGALYACGYSADTIEKMARTIDWDLLLTNAASLQSLNNDEKEEYNKYAVELPWANNGFRLPSGVFESEELWLKFSEFFFPVYNIKDFTKLPKGFKCVATDISTGEAVVMDTGEIVSAVRSSMAIPSVFTAVNYNGRKFIDGGVVRNFPVKDAKKMGADIVIGSNVAGGLLPKEKITNVFQVLLQVAFFRNDEDAAQERKLCDIYVKHDLENYSMGSFVSANEIIDEGIKKGDSIYPRLKKLADSLNAIYGKPGDGVNSLPEIDSVKITAYEIKGLKNTTEPFFLHRMEFENNRWYTARELSTCIRKAFGTRYYTRIVYSLQQLKDGTCRIIFDAEESPLTFAKLGVHYNTFTGISLIGNLTSRDFFTPYSRSFVTANIGENLRIKGEHLQYFGKFKTLALSTTIQGEALKFTTYNNFSKDGLYKRSYFVADINTHWNLKRKFWFGIGTRFEAFHYKPDITSKFEFRGSNNLFNSYLSLRLNTLSNSVYPRRGSKVDVEAGYVYSQHTDLSFYNDGDPIANTDSLGFNFNNFIRTKLNYEHYYPLSRRNTFFTQVQAGINFNQQESVLNDYFIGGLDRTFRNQITFAGLNEGTVYTSSAASLMFGLRYQMFNNLFLITKANALYRNFIGSNKNLYTASWLTGYAVTLGYNFVLGPLEISAMYCDQSKKLLPYINLGIPF
jgi:NTE family protein